jgi:hypothetical protein
MQVPGFDGFSGLFGSPAGHRFISEDDPTFEPYVVNSAIGYICQTPDEFKGERHPGSTQSSFRIQFTLPGQEDQPKTVEIMRTKKDNPSFGAVKIGTPIKMVVEKDLIKNRLIVREVGPDGHAKRARLMNGDIIRAVSSPRSQNGLMSLDGKSAQEYEAALNENGAEVVMVIERPTKDDEMDDWFKPGGRGEKVQKGWVEKMADSLKGADKGMAPNLR